MQKTDQSWNGKKSTFKVKHNCEAKTKNSLIAKCKLNQIFHLFSSLQGTKHVFFYFIGISCSRPT